METFSENDSRIEILKLEDLDTDTEYKIELEWLFEFSKELVQEYVLPEDKSYRTHVVGTIKWNNSMEQWQLIDIAIIDCHDASILKIYRFGQIVDLEEENIIVTKSSIRIIKEFGKDIQESLDEYKNEPKVKNLNSIAHDSYDDEFEGIEPMYY